MPAAYCRALRSARSGWPLRIRFPTRIWRAASLALRRPRPWGAASAKPANSERISARILAKAFVCAVRSPARACSTRLIGGPKEVEKCDGSRTLHPARKAPRWLKQAVAGSERGAGWRPTTPVIFPSLYCNKKNVFVKRRGSLSVPSPQKRQNTKGPGPPWAGARPPVRRSRIGHGRDLASGQMRARPVYDRFRCFDCCSRTQSALLTPRPTPRDAGRTGRACPCRVGRPRENPDARD